ncbi:MAG: acetate kinase, partial [Evtepia sp.]
MKVLVINAGSSSLKYQLLDPDTKEVLAKGLCERIGIDGHIKHTPTNKDVYDADRYMPDHEAAIKLVMEVLTHNYYGVIKDMSEIDAVGHRVVHGGEEFTHSVLIDRAVMKGIRECIPLAPLHNPANITGIEACQ